MKMLLTNSYQKFKKQKKIIHFQQKQPKEEKKKTQNPKRVRKKGRKRKKGDRA